MCTEESGFQACYSAGECLGPRWWEWALDAGRGCVTQVMQGGGQGQFDNGDMGGDTLSTAPQEFHLQCSSKLLWWLPCAVVAALRG